MDRLLYIAMSGASETMQAQSIRANNLANVSTPGFKSELSQQRSIPVYGDGYPSRVFSASESPGTNFDIGGMKTTLNEMDIAVNGEGFITVLDANGAEAYTRRGDLTISSDGFLINGAGNYINGQGGRIAIPPANSITFAQDGTISIVPKGSDPGTSVVINQIKLVNAAPKNMYKREDGLFAQKTDAPLENDPSVRIKSGVVELSNVNAVSEMIELISLARRHELDVKMMSKAEENDQAAARLLQFT